MPALPGAIMGAIAIEQLVEPYLPIAIDLLAKAAHGLFGEKKGKVIDMVANGLKGGVQEAAIFKDLLAKRNAGEHASPADILAQIDRIHTNADRIHDAAVKLGAPEDPKPGQPGGSGA